MKTSPVGVILAIGILAAGCSSEDGSEAEVNKQLVQRFTEISNAGDWDALAEIVADDFRRHSAATAGEPVRSRDAFIALQKSFLVTFPDQRVRIDDIFAEADRVAIRAMYIATQTGPMGDIPPTGRPVEGPFIAIFRMENDRIAELWVEWDNLALMSQLGLFPPGKAPE